MIECVRTIMERTDLTKGEAQEIYDTIKIQEKALKAQARFSGLEEKLTEISKEIGEGMKVKAAINRRNAALNAIANDNLMGAQGQITGGIKMTKGDYVESVRAPLVGSHRQFDRARESVALRAMSLRKELVIAGVEGRIRAERPHILTLFRKQDKAFNKKVAIEMHEIKDGGKRGISGDPDAEWVAKVFADITDVARIRLNKAGANIGKLPGWTPYSYDPSRTLKLGEEAFVKLVLENYDPVKSFKNLGPEEIDDILKETYKNITMGRDDLFSPARKGEYSGPRNLAKSMGKHRKIHFKDAEAWLRVNDAIGTGTVFDSIVHYLTKSSRNIALMEKFGPNPEVMLGSILKQTAERIKKSDLPEKKKTKQLAKVDIDLGQRRGAIGADFAVVSGENNVYTRHILGNIMSGMRAVQVLAKLGRAMVSSVNDIMTYAQAVRYRGEKNLLEAYSEAFHTYLLRMTTDEQHIFANALGATSDGIIADIASRYTAGDPFTGFAAREMDRFFRLSGLNWWTNRGKAGAVRGIATEMGSLAGKSYDQLSDTYRAWLREYGIEGNGWDALRKGTVKGEDGRTYIIPDRIENQEYRTLYHGLLSDSADAHVITPDARTQSFVQGSSKPHTPGGEVRRFMGQFKGFPLAFWQRTIRGGRYGRAGQQGPDLVGIANIIASSFVFGYASMTAKDFLSGRKPRSLKKLRTWTDAFVQGGAAGLYGDFLLSKYQRFGRGMAESVVGPAPAMAFDVVEMGTRLLDGDANAGEAFHVALNNMPYANLWYTRAVLDYLILYNIQEMLSPGTLQRRERRIKEEYNQEYILPPTDVIQYGGGRR